MKIENIKKQIEKKFGNKISVSEKNGAVLLEGKLNKWEEVIFCGKIAAKSEMHRGVINKISVEGIEIPKPIMPRIEDSIFAKDNYDVVIIGGGIIGCSIARELSRWDIKILLLDKENDFAMHTSSRNDGMIHPGIASKPGTKKAYYNVLGNKMYSEASKELGFDFKRIGSLIMYDGWYMRFLKPLIGQRAKKNGIEMEYINKNRIKEFEPNVNSECVGAIFLPSTGVISPYKATFAYAENAVQNGVKIGLETFVKGMRVENNVISSIQTNRGEIFTKLVINAAGVYSDEIADMAGDQFFTIHPRKGEIIILDKNTHGLVNSVVSKADFLSKKNTKGGGIVKTIEGNLLLGPSAYEQPFKEDYSTTESSINSVFEKERKILNISKNDIITYFSGTRASTYKEDFIIEKSQKIKNLVHAAGIQSPGIASAPAIAVEIEKICVNILKSMMDLKRNNKFNPKRNEQNISAFIDEKERNRLIHENPDFGKIICRCETISAAEVKNAIHSVIPALTIDAVKRRTRVGMGRCQGGFCTPLITKLIHEETGISYTEITKKGLGSNLLVAETKVSEVDKHERV